MLINFWDCEYSEADESCTDDYSDCWWTYYCNHPEGGDHCPLDNKWSGDKDDCKLLDKKEV